MHWKEKLVALYLYVCRCYDTKLCLHCQRMSNNCTPDFTDQEIITVYLFGIMQNYTELTDIVTYCRNHLLDWFPQLPSYQAFNYRLNRMYEVFPVLVEDILEQEKGVLTGIGQSLMDSMPIVVANGKRSGIARAAGGLCNKGKCASKGMYYYGAKLHVIGWNRAGTIPIPEMVGLTPAADNDLTVFKSIAPLLKDREIYGDKIYANQPLREAMAQQQNVIMNTPIKLKKGQEHLSARDQLLSTAVSRIRQPIESLFNWLEQKTGIQKANKVRSDEGLIIHVFGRLAAAMMMMVYPLFNS